MAATQAEFLYVKGPQTGQRASLMSTVVVIGRGQQADVQLTEEHVSRRHFQLTLTQDGWVFENLSPLKSRVNGKKYKTGKKIILDTGDVISVGSETELLFVATGDDPEAALIVYRQSGANKAKKEPATAQAVIASDIEKPSESEGPTPPALSDNDDQEELEPEEKAALALKAKYKKYAVVFGTYFAVLAIIVGIVVTQFDRPSARKEGRPELLNKVQIEDAIAAKLRRDQNSVEARNALDKALLALDRTHEVDYLYKALYWFKLARAYGKVLTTEEEKFFRGASRKLTKQVQEKYYNAYAHEGDRKYLKANSIYRGILDMLPPMGKSDEKNEVRDNVIAHVAYIKRVQKSSRRRR
ncbi:MAG: FHA domain-containing protein [bacterium]|nr:FHA domain-containing protein [bacterium]